MTVYSNFHKVHFERLCWIYSIFRENLKSKKLSNISSKLFNNGVFSILFFDNFVYFTGAHIERENGKTTRINCPMSFLDLNKPVHWSKEASKMFDKVILHSSEKILKTKPTFIIMDIRHFMRLMDSKNLIKTFVYMSYNGIIFSTSSKRLWFKLRLKTLFT